MLHHPGKYVFILSFYSASNFASRKTFSKDHKQICLKSCIRVTSIVRHNSEALQNHPSNNLFKTLQTHLRRIKHQQIQSLQQYCSIRLHSQLQTQDIERKTEKIVHQIADWISLSHPNIYRTFTKTI